MFLSKLQKLKFLTKLYPRYICSFDNKINDDVMLKNNKNPIIDKSISDIKTKNNERPKVDLTMADSVKEIVSQIDVITRKNKFQKSSKLSSERLSEDIILGDSAYTLFMKNKLLFNKNQNKAVGENLLTLIFHPLKTNCIPRLINAYCKVYTLLDMKIENPKQIIRIIQLLINIYKSDQILKIFKVTPDTLERYNAHIISKLMSVAARENNTEITQLLHDYTKENSYLDSNDFINNIYLHLLAKQNKIDKVFKLVNENKNINNHTICCLFVAIQTSKIDRIDEVIEIMNDNLISPNMHTMYRLLWALLAINQKNRIHEFAHYFKKLSYVRNNHYTAIKNIIIILNKMEVPKIDILEDIFKHVFKTKNCKRILNIIDLLIKSKWILSSEKLTKILTREYIFNLEYNSIKNLIKKNINILNDNHLLTIFENTSSKEYMNMYTFIRKTLNIVISKKIFDFIIKKAERIDDNSFLEIFEDTKLRDINNDNNNNNNKYENIIKYYFMSIEPSTVDVEKRKFLISKANKYFESALNPENQVTKFSYYYMIKIYSKVMEYQNGYKILEIYEKNLDKTNEECREFLYKTFIDDISDYNSDIIHKAFLLYTNSAKKEKLKMIYAFIDKLGVEKFEEKEKKYLDKLYNNMIFENKRFIVNSDLSKYPSLIKGGINYAFRDNRKSLELVGLRISAHKRYYIPPSIHIKEVESEGNGENIISLYTDDNNK